MDKKKRKYELLTYKQRLEIIEILKNDEQNGVKSDFSKIGRQFNVSRHTIRRIQHSKENVEEEYAKYQDMPSFSKRKKPVNSKNDLLEEVLYEWFKQRRAAGQPITSNILQDKALQINESIDGDPDFRASTGWLSRFKNRYEFRSFGIQGDKLSVDYDNNVEFIDKLATIIRMRNFQLYQIYNADETELLWKLLPSVNFIAEYEKNEKGIKFSKERVTLMVCANADGSHKIPLFMIGKSKKPQCFKNIQNLPVTYDSQKNGLMTRELFKKWYIKIFLPSVQKFQLKQEKFYNILLILDNANCHLSKEEIDSINNMCTVEFLLPNVTSLIQPMNQGIIEKLKKLFRKSLLREMLLEEDKMSIIEFLKVRNMKTCCVQIANAWDEITDTNIRRAWRKIIPSCDIDIMRLDRSLQIDDYLQIFDRIPGFERIMPGIVSSWLEEDANDPGWEVFNIQQILSSIQNSTIGAGNTEISEVSLDERIRNVSEVEEIYKEEEEVYEDDDTEIENIQVKSEEALECFQKFREWFERRRECESEHIMQLQQIHELSMDIASNTNFINVDKNN